MKFTLSSPKYLLVFFILGFFIYTAYSLYTYAHDSPYIWTPEKAKKAIQEGRVDIVLDVRTKIEKDVFGSYPGSFHIPVAEIEQRLEKEFPNKGTRFLVYCNTGQRARNAVEKMRSMGYNYSYYIPTSHVSIL